MRKVIILITLAAGSMLVSGCDFIRNIAGRPSEDDIHLLSLAKKSSLEVADFIASDTVSFNATQEPEPVLEISRHKKVKDIEDQQKADEAIKQMEREMQQIEQQGSEPVVEPAKEPVKQAVAEPAKQPVATPAQESTKSSLTVRHWGKNIDDNAGLARYYVSVGIFSSETNARNQAKWASNSGYTPTIILFNNGRFCVCVCPSETVSGINSQLDKLLKKPFCPADAFIIDTQQ